MLRSILKIKLKDKVRISAIKSKFNIHDIGGKIVNLKWKYAGHVARENKNKWNKIATFWTSYGNKRSRGRPALRWRDELVRERGMKWQCEARDREKWRGLVEAYALRKGGVEG